MAEFPNPRRLPAVPPHNRRPTPPPLAESPRVRALAGADAAALAAFWRQVEAEGTPLVEPAEDAAHRIVTFLWRDAGQGAVLLHANKLTDYNDLGPSLLHLLPGTDVWHRSYRLRADWRGTYQLAPLPEPPAAPEVWRGPERARWRELQALAVTDPLNPGTLPNKFGGPALSLAALPDAPPQPWLFPRPDRPVGRVTEHRFDSAVLGNEREVWLYQPPGEDHADLPLLVLFDGEAWVHDLGVTHTLDNLIAEGAIPPMAALLVSSLNLPARVVELACDELFLRMLTEELLPWAGRQLPLTTDPRRTVVAGQSLGGLTAAFAGLRAPHRFGNVLAQSGSFWWPSGTAFEAGAQWLTQALATEDKLPVAFDLEVGLLEWELLEPTRRLRDVLRAKGYDLSYREFHGGHDSACWRGGLADGLRALTSRWATVNKEATRA
ncbi:enterochelin esterase [Crossiella sp. CA198]|uniref:enterochelin esterase n=1 Tax=Crossiella sp. CA198 TaxID=3455607 RepID=UPI003F8D16FC